MNVNLVTVSINATDQNGGNLDDGHLHFEVDDIVWVDSLGIIAVIEPVDIYASGGLSTGGSVKLVAMDNAGVSTNWSWIVSGELAGVTIPPRKLIVNFANGSTQSLTTLLDSSTLVT